jgi:hypothetical protein
VRFSRRLVLCLAGLGIFLVPSVRGVEWTEIEVQARLDDDGRLRIVETHHMRLDASGAKGLRLFREFGLGADQSIAFKGLTRIDADGTEHPLIDATVDRPDRYRYYPRGHVYYQIPDLDANAEIVYRFEYELLNPLAPAWGIAAGWHATDRSASFVAPWRRAAEVLADLRAAWPEPDRRYRLDHDVLFPSRDGPGYVSEHIDYRLEYGAAWKRRSAAGEATRVKRGDDYRVRPLFEHVGAGQPASAARHAARVRWGCLAALPLAGFLPWPVLHALGRRRRRLGRWLLIALAVAGVAVQISDSGGNDATLFLLLFDAFGLVLAAVGPRWSWGNVPELLACVLVPPILLSLAFAAAQLSVNVPFPPSAWLGGVIVAAACQGAFVPIWRLREDYS